MKNQTKNDTKGLVIKDIWLILLVLALYLYMFQKGFLETQIRRVFDAPLHVRYVVYLVLGCLRGFTLIPVTYLIIFGLLFLPSIPLFILTIIGIVVTSAIIYYFSEYIHLGSYFQKKYPAQIDKLKDVLEKHEVPIVALWSMMPLVPTDLICYVGGSLRINVQKILLGVFIGETIACAVYIFFGKELLLMLPNWAL